MLAVAGAGAKADPTRLRFVDVCESSVDPLARALRNRLRKDHGIMADVPVLLSTEKPRCKLVSLVESDPQAPSQNLADYQASRTIFTLLCSLYFHPVSNHAASWFCYWNRILRRSARIWRTIRRAAQRATLKYVQFASFAFRLRAVLQLNLAASCTCTLSSLGDRADDCAAAAAPFCVMLQLDSAASCVLNSHVHVPSRSIAAILRHVAGGA